MWAETWIFVHVEPAASITDLARTVANRLGRPCEYRTVTDVSDCLARIDELEPQLHAFQAVRKHEALVEAASADPSLPLAGVPVAIKDNVDVAGLPTRAGSAGTLGPAGRAG